MKPIAGINKYPFGVCGFIVDGVLLKDGTKLKDLRIYKQRSINMFDLINPYTSEIYQKVQLTGYSKSKEVLNYDLNDDEILEIIPKNTFFVRGYNNNMSSYGFVIRFLLNKVVLSDGNHAYLYDMYIPQCDIPTPDLGNIIINTVTVDSTEVSGSVSALNGKLKEDGMILTLMTPEGKVYHTTILNRTFIFTDVELVNAGTGTIIVNSPYYNTKVVEFEVLPSSADTDFTTTVPVSSNEMIDNGNNTFSFTLSASQHNRGTDLVIQIQDTNGAIYVPVINVDSMGNITVTQNVDQDFDIVIIGPTNLTDVYSTALNFTLDSSVYKMEIPFSVHNKSIPTMSVYNNTELVDITVQVDDDFNVTLISNDEFTGKVVIAGN